MTLQDMLRTHPRQLIADRDAILTCIAECLNCAAICTSCADACLGEPNVQELVRCIRLNLDCADSCDTTGRTLTRQTQADPAVLRTAVEACGQACQACAHECERHAEHHDHCAVCAAACRRCEQACNDLLSTI